MKEPLYIGCFTTSAILLEQSRLHDVARVRVAPEVTVCQLRNHTSARRALDESLHDEERLVHLFHSTRILTNGSGYGRYAHRTSTELVHYRYENLIVYLVKTVTVYIESRQAHTRNVGIYAARTLSLIHI